MQAYLESYVEQHKLGGMIRLNTEVITAQPVDSGWLVEASFARLSSGISTLTVRHSNRLVIPT